MPQCTRCGSFVLTVGRGRHGCKNSSCGLYGKCNTCGSYSCKGNCSVPIGHRPNHLKCCAVCGKTYTFIHGVFDCKRK